MDAKQAHFCLVYGSMMALEQLLQLPPLLTLKENAESGDRTIPYHMFNCILDGGVVARSLSLSGWGWGGC